MSNGYAVGLSNSSVIFNPVGKSSGSYFSKKLAFGENITVPYHEINRVIRKYIYSIVYMYHMFFIHLLMDI